jgi:hypothetical protein
LGPRRHHRLWTSWYACKFLLHFLIVRA